MALLHRDSPPPISKRTSERQGHYVTVLKSIRIRKIYSTDLCFEYNSSILIGMDRSPMTELDPHSLSEGALAFLHELDLRGGTLNGDESLSSWWELAEMMPLDDSPASLYSAVQELHKGGWIEVERLDGEIASATILWISGPGRKYFESPSRG